MSIQIRRLAHAATVGLVLALAPVAGTAAADPAATGSVSGTLADGATPVADATVELLVLPYGVPVKQGRTDAGGAFRILDVPPQAQPDTLRDWFEARGRHIGAAVQASKLADPVYTTILNREFNSVTPEIELEWDSVEPAQGQFVFTRADQIVLHAGANDMEVRGRSVVAPGGIHSAWFGNLNSASSLHAAMERHITAVLSHYRGQVRSWGVVTETFAENGTLRRSPFQAYLGASFVEQAFRMARAADPDAALCYSDFNIDDFTRPKTQAVYAMVRDFKVRGVPIDCVGLQSHFTATNPLPSSYQRTIAEFAALGVEVQISELDIAGSGAEQATKYSRVVASCLAVPRCTGITVWGVRDTDSWRPADTPLLFDGAGNPKPAYYAVLTT